jgi:hypothetical protein
VSSQEWCEDFFWQNLRALAPMAAMFSGVITLLGHHCGYPLRAKVPCENPRPCGLNGSGIVRHYPLGGIIVESRYHSIFFNVFVDLVFLFFHYL